MFRWLVGLVMALLCILSLSRASHAIPRTYQPGGIDNEWFNAANWDPNGVPFPEDDLTVATGNPSTTTQVDVNEGGSLLVTGTGTTATFDRMDVGTTAPGSLTIEQGAVVNGFISIVGETGTAAMGDATVTGTGSHWNLSGGLSVGRNSGSIGSLSVLNQGLLTSTQFLSVGVNGGSSGSLYIEDATVTSAGFVDAGSNGVGLIELAAGASLTSTNTLRVGNFVPGEGTVLVDASTLSMKSFTIGGSGDGTLDATGGATLTGTGTSSGDILRVGDTAGGAGDILVSGIGTRLDLANQGAQIGNRGTGTVEVLDGAEFLSRSGTLGAFTTTSEGSVLVSGSGSQWTMTSTLQVGNEGKGLLEVLDGAMVTFDSGTVAPSAGSEGIVAISGTGSLLSQTNPGGVFVVGNGGTGRVELSNGGELSTVRTLIEAGGTLAGSGTHSGDLQVRGRVEPGLSPGGLLLLGDYLELPSATLEIELAGTVPQLEHDVLDVTGMATLAGDLTLSLLGGFSPQATDTFSILTSSAISGSFANVASGTTLATVDGMGEFTVHYGTGSPFDPGQVVLTNYQSLVAGSVDTEPDGDIDGADFLTLQRDSPALIPTWQSAYGTGAVSSPTPEKPVSSPTPEELVSSPTRAIPEPSALALLLAATLLGFWQRVK